MDDLSWLSKLCHPDFGPDNIRGRPFSLTVDGQPWAVAANGYMIVAVVGENGFMLPLAKWVENGSTKVVEDCLRFNASGVPVDLKQLKQWCGKPEWDYREGCEFCYGDGKLQNDLICPDCKGKGFYVIFPVRRGRINDALINRELLARALHRFSDCEVRIAFSLEIDLWGSLYSALICDGAGWRVVLISMRGVKETEDVVFWVEKVKAVNS